MNTCYKCNTKLNLADTETIPRSESCPTCLTDIRCCKMCLFYDTKSYNDCRESSAMRIVEKEKANFCDYYRISNQENKQESTQSLLDKANALFKS